MQKERENGKVYPVPKFFNGINEPGTLNGSGFNKDTIRIQ